MKQEEELQPGTRVPGTQYVVQRTLGRGGHGVVLEVEHAFLAKSYVMKVLHATLADSEEVARRMREEARILARMDHPNIVRVVDGGMTAERDARPYFVMSSLKGEPLLNVLRRRGVGIGAKAAIHIALDVLDALDTAHMQHQLVHRDIKPANIFLCRLNPNEVRAVLLDFGVARVLASPLRHTQGPTFLGTLRYAAPEQLRGDATFSSDLYAVGICLFETLTGKHPLGLHKAQEDWVRAHTRVEPMRLGDCIDAPASLEAFVARALAKKEEDRFPSAFAMAGALRLLLDELPDAVDNDAEDQTESMVLEHALTTVSRKTAWIPAAAAAPEMPAPDALESTVDERQGRTPASLAPNPAALEAFRPSRNPLPETWKKPRESPVFRTTTEPNRIRMCLAAAAVFGLAIPAGNKLFFSPKPEAQETAHLAADPTPAPAANPAVKPVPAGQPLLTPVMGETTEPTSSGVEATATSDKISRTPPAHPGPKRLKVSTDEVLRLRAHKPNL